MIERFVEIEKDNVSKKVNENLVSIYLNMGWSKVEDKGKKSVINSIKKSISKED